VRDDVPDGRSVLGNWNQADNFNRSLQGNLDYRASAATARRFGCPLIAKKRMYR
jgi:hypothetical protein